MRAAGMPFTVVHSEKADKLGCMVDQTGTDAALQYHPQRRAISAAVAPHAPNLAYCMELGT